MASFSGHPWGEPDDSGPDPRPGDTGGPVLAGGPVEFMCCDPCADGRCEKIDCDHAELDQKQFARAEDALGTLYGGLMAQNARLSAEVASLRKRVGNGNWVQRWLRKGNA